MLFRYRRPGSVHHQCGPLGRTKNYESGALGLKAVSARALCRVVRRMAPGGQHSDTYARDLPRNG